MSVYWQAAGVSAVAAALYSLSPLSAICIVVMAWMAQRAVADLGPAERRWFGGALVVGILLRLVSVLGVFLLTTDRAQFNVLFGDGRFAVDESIWILNRVMGVPISPYYWSSTFENFGDVGYHHALAVIQWWLGQAPYAIGLINIVFFEAFTIIFYRLTRLAFGARAGIAALIAVLFWPTIFVWSFSTMKESIQLALAAGALAGTVAFVRARGSAARLKASAGVAVALLVLSELRPGSSVMVTSAIVFGLLAHAAMRRTSTTAVALGLIVVGVLAGATRPWVQARVQFETRLALVRHIGHVRSRGISYRAADERFYTGDKETPWSMTAAEGERFLVRSAAAFFLAPLPSDIRSAAAWLFVPLNLAWYVLLALAAFGIPTGLRRDRLVTLLSIGYVAAGLVVIAPNSGNIGTLVRHRDMVVPFVMCLSSVGLIQILSTLAPAPPRQPPAAPGCPLEGDVCHAAD